MIPLLHPLCGCEVRLLFIRELCLRACSLNQDLGYFQSALHRAVENRNGQLVDSFLHKVIQLHETINVRFGVTVVGPTGSGKSMAWKVLSDALTAHAKAAYSPAVIHTQVLNPKSVDMKARFAVACPPRLCRLLNDRFLLFVVPGVVRQLQ